MHGRNSRSNGRSATLRYDVEGILKLIPTLLRDLRQGAAQAGEPPTRRARRWEPLLSAPKSPTPLLVHDYLLVMRGAERIFAAITEMWPDAPIAHDCPRSGGDRTAPSTATRSAPPTFSACRPTQRSFRTLLPLYPSAMERLHVDDAERGDLEQQRLRPRRARARGRRCTSATATRPFRYAWHERERRFGEVPALPPARCSPRRSSASARWDRRRPQRVTRYIANSELGRERIARFYGREAAVIHPPVDVDRFRTGEPGDSFVFVGELVRHKRVDIGPGGRPAAPGARLKVVGTGPERTASQPLRGHCGVPRPRFG